MDLGVAFQIADDVLDLVGDEAVAGKSLGTDLEQEKLTLPLIRLRDAVGGAPERLFEAAVDLRTAVAGSGALAYAKRRAEEFAARRGRRSTRCRRRRRGTPWR